MPLVTRVEAIAGAIAGDLVSFPTDTVPALAAKPERAEAIYLAKQRAANKPLILMGADPEDLWIYARGSDREFEQWQQVARQHWPGALTLVVPASARVPPEVNGGAPTIGLRVPASDVARSLLAETGPLATTSANRSGEPPLTTPSAIASSFPEALVLNVPVGSYSGVPSTVARWTGQHWEILRQGAVQLTRSSA